jgi:hypothetical protein
LFFQTVNARLFVFHVFRPYLQDRTVLLAACNNPSSSLLPPESRRPQSRDAGYLVSGVAERLMSGMEGFDAWSG